MIIALNFEFKSDFYRGILEGVMAYAADHDGVKVWFGNQGKVHGCVPERLDAVIGNRHLDRVPTYTPSTPVINVTHDEMPGAPQVISDNMAIAQMALDHFIACNLRSFAFVPWGGSQGAQDRLECFAEACSEKGYYMRIVPILVDGEHIRFGSDAKDLLKELPKPAGVLAYNDGAARMTVDLCREIGLSVPRDCSVLGIGNHSGMRLSSRPTISSIDVDLPRIGWVAAKTAVDLVEGNAVPDLQLIEPKELIQGESTGVATRFSPEVETVIAYMHQQLGEPLRMEDLVRQQRLGRRALEKLFHQETGASPMQYLKTLRLQKVKHLLEIGELNIAEIARACGFVHSTYLSRIFKEAFDTTAADYRRNRHRAADL